jgi:hypothetical protein
MNAERLHTIAVSLKKEAKDRGIVTLLSAVVGLLEDPKLQKDSSLQRGLANNLKALYSALSDTNSDAFSLEWRQVLRGMGGERLYGAGLKQRVEGVLAGNRPANAVGRELGQVLTDLKEFESGLQDLILAFRLFHVKEEKLDPGECEIGLFIPRAAVRNRLLDFAGELKDLGFVLNTLSEVVTGQTDDLTIRAISSSELLVYLRAGAPYAACVAVAIERVVALYKQVLEIRRLHQEIQKQGVPREQTAGIESYVNQLMETGIGRVSAEIVNEFYKGKDDARKHELSNAVRISLNRIANRIDRGFVLQVRCEPIAKTHENPKDEEVQKAMSVVQAANANTKYPSLGGQPVLTLPEDTQRLT